MLYFLLFQIQLPLSWHPLGTHPAPTQHPPGTHPTPTWHPPGTRDTHPALDSTLVCHPLCHWLWLLFRYLLCHPLRHLNWHSAVSALRL